MNNQEKLKLYGSVRPSMVLYDITMIRTKQKEFISLKDLVDGVTQMLKKRISPLKATDRIVKKENFLDQQYKELMSGKKIKLFQSV